MKIFQKFLVTVFLVGTMASAVAPAFSTAQSAPSEASTPGSAVAAGADTVAAPAPHLQLDSAYLDLGRIELDSVGEGVMRFRNTGDAPLVIQRVFTDCGCTVPSYSSRPVAPGDTGIIRVRFKTKGRSPGYFRKTLRVKSNADNPRVGFAVRGHVVIPNRETR